MLAVLVDPAQARMTLRKELRICADQPFHLSIYGLTNSRTVIQPWPLVFPTIVKASTTSEHLVSTWRRPHDQQSAVSVYENPGLHHHVVRKI